jgi:8-oxo-dGTP diphosphatase
MTVGHFLAGIAAVIRSPGTGQYLLLHRSEEKDFGQGIWECLTGRVDQGEGFEQALHREVREELGVQVKAEHILGTTHFYRGPALPQNELVGVVYLCSLPATTSIRLSSEHSEYRWLLTHQALELLSATDPSTQWAHRLIERAELIRPLLPGSLVSLQRQAGFEFG